MRNARAALVLLLAAVSAGLMLWTVWEPIFVGPFLGGLLLTALILFLIARSAPKPVEEEEEAAAIDVPLLRAALEASSTAVAITDLEGEPICANDCHVEWFGAARSPVDHDRLAGEARRSGRAADEAGALQVEVVRSGTHLVWKYRRSDEADLVREAKRHI